MLPRRRNIGGVTERLLENDLDTYDKLDKKGAQPSNNNSSIFNPFPKIQVKQVHSNHIAEPDITFEILEEFVFEPVMAARDRTNEFISAVRSLQGRTLARPVIRDERKAQMLETYSQFMGMAKVISKNITSTYAKLEKLAMCKYNKFFFLIIHLFRMSTKRYHKS